MTLLAQLWAAMRLHPGITACLLVSLLAGFANYPLWRQRQAVTRQHAEVRLRGETMLDALNNRSRITADLSTLAEAQEVIDRNLISEHGMEENLGYFYRLEKLNRVRLSRIDQMGTPTVEAESPFKTVPISLQASGTYRNLLGFMRDLETGPRILRTRSYRLERTEPNGGELVLLLTVDLLARP